MDRVPPILQLMDDCAQYAADCYIKALANELRIDCPIPSTNETIPEEFLVELRVLAHRAAQAV